MIRHLVAITGGIGAGKSVVSRILRAKGYHVYDCDSRARAIMDSDPEIKTRLRTEIHPGAVLPDGTIDRPLVASVVFTDPGRLAALNAIVHRAVRDDIARWRATTGAPLAFIETAILYQSGLDRMVDEIWEVDAPEEIRVARACSRDNTSPEAVRRRIASQAPKKLQNAPDVPTTQLPSSLLLNDDCHSLLLRIDALLAHTSGADKLINRNPDGEILPLTNAEGPTTEETPAEDPTPEETPTEETLAEETLAEVPPADTKVSLKAVVLTLLLGLMLSIGSTFSYSTYLFDGWPMWGIIIWYSAMQIPFCGFFLNININRPDNSKLRWNRATRDFAASCALPFLFVFFINDLLPFFFLGKHIRLLAYNFFAGDLPHVTVETLPVDAPGFFSFVLEIILLSMLFVAIYTGKKDIHNRTGFLLSLALIFLAYGGIFHSLTESNHETERKIASEATSMRIQSNSLRLARASQAPELSFKGIALNSDFEKARNIIDSISNKTDEYWVRHNYNSSMPNYSFVTKSQETIIDDILDVHNIYLDPCLYQVNSHLGIATIGNIKTKFTILAIDSKVFCIIASVDGTKEFESLLSLYTEKYGEPEINPEIRLTLGSHPNPADNIYTWTFQNGTIRLTKNEIVYISSGFLYEAKDKIAAEQEKTRIAAEKAARGQAKRDSIIRIRRERANQNAINDI